jgi:F-type H+-transporting ATPase subunit delta
LRPHLLAKRYARALFQLSEREKTSEQWLTGLGEIRALLERETRIRAFLHSPRVDKPRKAAMLRQLLEGKIAPLLLNFMRLLVDKGRLSILPDILFEYGRFCDHSAGRLRATVISAVPVARTQLQEVEHRLGRQFGAAVICDNRVDPDILGGLIVQVEGRVVDGSLRHQLERLTRELKQSRYQTN